MLSAYENVPIGIVVAATAIYHDVNPHMNYRMLQKCPGIPLSIQMIASSFKGAVMLQSATASHSR